MATRDAVLVCRHQALVPATPRSVWELVGQPNRHPEWWPEVIEVQGKRFGRGCEYCHVAREGDGVTETNFLIEKVEELKELLVRCEETGLYMRWRLTEVRRAPSSTPSSASIHGRRPRAIPTSIPCGARTGCATGSRPHSTASPKPPRWTFPADAREAAGWGSRALTSPPNMGSYMWRDAHLGGRMRAGYTRAFARVRAGAGPSSRPPSTTFDVILAGDATAPPFVKCRLNFVVPSPSPT
jgi:hypothetical protein